MAAYFFSVIFETTQQNLFFNNLFHLLSKRIIIQQLISLSYEKHLFNFTFSRIT